MRDESFDGSAMLAPSSAKGYQIADYDNLLNPAAGHRNQITDKKNTDQMVGIFLGWG